MTAAEHRAHAERLYRNAAADLRFARETRASMSCRLSWLAYAKAALHDAHRHLRAASRIEAEERAAEAEREAREEQLDDEIGDPVDCGACDGLGSCERKCRRCGGTGEAR